MAISLPGHFRAEEAAQFNALHARVFQKLMGFEHGYLMLSDRWSSSRSAKTAVLGGQIATGSEERMLLAEQSHLFAPARSKPAR
jgi:hypothetical protein